MEKKNSAAEGYELLVQGKMMKQNRDEIFRSIRRNYGLKQVEVEVLITLADRSAASAKEIADALFLTKGHVSLAVECLTGKHLISCMRDHTDRRCVRLSLTAEGKQIADEIFCLKEELDQRMLRGFSEEEIRQFKDYCRRITENIETERRRSE